MWYSTCSQETGHVLQDGKVHQHYCVVYLAYERLKIEILVTPLPTALIVLRDAYCQAILVRYGPLLPYREDSPQ